MNKVINDLIEDITEFKEQAYMHSAKDKAQELEDGVCDEQECVAYLTDLHSELIEMAMKERWDDQGWLCDVAYHGPYG